MREIKFRAWNTFTKQMIDLQKITPLAIAEPLEGLFIPKDDALKVMQFTGLKDKNGKEIYEGDVLKRHYQRGETDEWIYREVKADQCGWNLRDYAIEICEITGNIYENPDLIDI